MEPESFVLPKKYSKVFYSLFLAFFSTLMALNIDQNTKPGRLLGILVAMFCTIYLIYILMMDFFTTIRIFPSGIFYKNLKKEYFYEWNNVKSWGVYIAKRYSGIQYLDEVDFNKSKYWGYDKIIFLTFDSFITPMNQDKVSASFLEFRYNKNAFNLIKKCIINKQLLFQPNKSDPLKSRSPLNSSKL